MKNNKVTVGQKVYLFDAIVKLCGNNWETESEPLTHEEFFENIWK